MGEHDPTEYGTHIAADYDEIYGAAFDTDGAVACLAELAADGPILELGVGTGRLALPLAARGLTVHGVDSSAEMLELLHAKPDGEAVTTTLADFCDVRVGDPGRFSLVVLAVNTMYALGSQAEQVQCFETAAWHLAPGGCFVVEAWVPEPIPPGVSLQPRLLSPGYVGLVVADHDPARQILSTQQIVFGGEAKVRVFPVVHRYAWPSELDVMARMNALHLERRWQDWSRTPYGPLSRNHVSVYRASPDGDT
jgi:Predicted methyltransferase (contains TPR repeat)